MTASPAALSTVLTRFSGDPTRTGKLLRDALDRDSTAFLKMVVGAADCEIGDRGFRYALILLRNDGLLCPAVANPAITSFPDALALTRHALALDAGFVNALVDEVLVRTELRGPECILRVLNLIDKCPDNVVNWRGIARLYGNADSRVKAKCATLLVRHRYDERSTALRFEEGEPRVRANIVEALSEKDRSKAAGLVEQALADTNNRVRGNACLALYNSGDARALMLISQMLDSPTAEFQVTAAWVMGETRDIRFSPALAQAARSPDVHLRKTALKSLNGLDRIESSESPESLRPVVASAPLAFGRKELWVRILNRSDSFVRGLSPLDFFLCSGGGMLLDYSVEQCAVSDPVSLRIVYPADCPQIEQAILDSLSGKPRSQRWALSAYGHDIKPHQQAADPQFFRDDEDLALAFGKGVPGTLNAARSCRSLLRLDACASEQHLIVMADAEWAAGKESADVRNRCRERAIRLHCLPFPATGLLDGAASTWPKDGIREMWSRFVESLQERYTVCPGTHARSGELMLRDCSTKPSRFSKPVTFSVWEDE